MASEPQIPSAWGQKREQRRAARLVQRRGARLERGRRRVHQRANRRARRSLDQIRQVDEHLEETVRLAPQPERVARTSGTFACREEPDEGVELVSD